MRFLDKLFRRSPQKNSARIHIHDVFEDLLKWGDPVSLSWTTTYHVEDEPREAKVFLSISIKDGDGFPESKALIKAILSGFIMKQDQLDDAFLSHQLGLDTEGSD